MEGHGARGCGCLALAEDFEGAIEDFQYYVDDGQADSEQKAKRRDWITELEANINPFDSETLETLRNE